MSLEAVGVVTSLAGTALLVGAALLDLAVLRPREPAAEQREQTALAVGGALLVFGSVALLLQQGGQAPLRVNALLTARGLAGVAVLAAAAVLTPARLRVIALAAGVAAAILTVVG